NRAAACKLGTLAAGETRTIVVRVRATKAGQLVNGVDVFAPQDATLEKKVKAPPVTVTQTGTPPTPPPPFDVTKSGPATAPVGSTIDYTVTVHNPRSDHS